jgi:hypothetical protein
MLPTKYQFKGDFDEQRSFDHEECGDTRSRLSVRFTGRGYKHHCYNCAPEMSGFTYADSHLSAGQLLRAMQEPTPVEEQRELTLPDDFTLDIPPREYLWLQKWITTDEISENKIGYSPSMQRIIFPIYDGEGEVLYWQARTLEGTPKWLNKKTTARNVFFASGDITNKKVCLVEAILSAIKVGRHCYAIALLGSYVPTEINTVLNQAGEEVYIWLDKDKQATTVRETRRLALVTGKRITPVLTNKKPRDYKDIEIRGYLQDNQDRQTTQCSST